MSEKSNPIAEYIKANPYKGPLFKGVRDFEAWSAYEIYFEDVGYYADTATDPLGYTLFRAFDDQRVIGIRVFKQALLEAKKVP